VRLGLPNSEMLRYPYHLFDTLQSYLFFAKQAPCAFIYFRHGTGFQNISPLLFLTRMLWRKGEKSPSGVPWFEFNS